MTAPRYNFASASMMILDPERSAARLVAGMLSGFGVVNPFLVHDNDEAGVLLGAGVADAAIVTMGRKAEPVLEMIANVRAAKESFVRFMPIIVLTGEAQSGNIFRARDAGANFVVRRPIAPGTLFDRLVWAAYSDRKFVQTRSYRGPDRRFRDQGPPPGGERRVQTKAVSTNGQEISRSEARRSIFTDKAKAAAAEGAAARPFHLI